MKWFFLTVCIVFGTYQIYEKFKPGPTFISAEPTLQVTQLQGTSVVHQSFNPRLTPYLALYHGASWCSPCQQFSPRLCEFFHSANKTLGHFQLLMVNYDRSDGEMIAYMREHNMEFPAVSQPLAGKWGTSTGNGIPNLIVVETATGKVVSSSFSGSDYVGCDKPLSVLMKIASEGHP